MANLTPTQLYKVIDKLTAVYRQVLGTGSNGLGDATFGASYKALDLKNLVSGASDSTFCDPDIQIPLSPATSRLSNDLTTQMVWGGISQRTMNALASLCSLATTVDARISDLDSFMQFYNYVNGVTYWQCLAPPDWYYMYYATRATYPSPKNMYYPVVQAGTTLGNTFLLGLARLVIAGPTFTDGFTIDYTKWAGGFPYIVWTGGTSGGGAVSISVTGKDQDGAVETFTASGTWGVGSYVATNTGIALVGSNPNSLITDVTAISISGMTGGTAYIEAHAPSGRTYPPT